MESKKWSLNSEEIKKFLKNTSIFFAPLALLYLGFVISEINKDGLQITDFVPTNPVIGAMVLYVLNVLVDFFKKLGQGA